MKILIVDDSENARITLRKDLESQNYQVLEAADGVDGLEIAKTVQDIKLVISDINMPRMDGILMAQKMRDLPQYKSIPVILITTEATPDLKIKAKQAGILTWITKPYVVEKLLVVVASIVK